MGTDFTFCECGHLKSECKCDHTDDSPRDVDVKRQLVALCEGLELKEIDKLLTKTPGHFRTIGTTIARFAELGAMRALLK